MSRSTTSVEMMGNVWTHRLPAFLTKSLKRRREAEIADACIWILWPTQKTLKSEILPQRTIQSCHGFPVSNRWRVGLWTCRALQEWCFELRGAEKALRVLGSYDQTFRFLIMMPKLKSYTCHPAKELITKRIRELRSGQEEKDHKEDEMADGTTTGGDGR